MYYPLYKAVDGILYMLDNMNNGVAHYRVIGKAK